MGCRALRCAHGFATGTKQRFGPVVAKGEEKGGACRSSRRAEVVVVARLPAHVIDEIRSRFDIVDVVSEYVPLQRSGRGYKGLCPFHTEKTPSFHVNRERQFFYCFGCQTGGDLFHFLMKIERATFAEVAEKLAERAGIELAPASPEEERRRRQREAIFKANRAAADFFVKALYADEGKGAREYLKGRGLTKETAQAFSLGYAPPGWHRLREHLERSGIREEIAVAAGLLARGRKGAYDWLRDRIVFPIFDVRGRIVGFGGRLLDGDGAKYVNTAESPVFSKRSHLYGLHLAKEERSGRLVVVEGYMDVVSLYQHGVRGCVASLGTAFTEEQARLLKRFADQVVMAYDGDAAGRKATARGLDILAAAGLEVRVLRLPEGHDPDSYVRSEGAEAFQRLLEESLPLVEYKVEAALSSADVTSVEGRMAAVRAVLPVLASIDSPVGLEGYLAETAQRIGVSVAALAEELERYKRGGSRESSRRHNLSTGRYTIRDFGEGRRNEPARRSVPAPGGADAAERELLRWVLTEPKKADAVAARLGEEPFSRPEYTRVFQWIRSQRDAIASGEIVVSRIEDPEVARIAGALLAEGGRPPGPFQAYLDRVGVERMRRQVRSLEAKLSLLMKEDGITPGEVGRLVWLYKEVRDQLHRMRGKNKAS